MRKRSKSYNKCIDVFDTAPVCNDLKGKAIHSGVYAFAAEGINFVVRVGSISVLARILVPEDFGLLSMVTALTVVAAQFKDMGLSLATIQQKDVTHEQVSTLFWINCGVGLGITLILCTVAKFVGWFYGDNRLVWITIAVATTFFWSGITVQHQALLRRRMEYLKLGVINVGANIGSIVFAIGLAVKGYGYWALVFREVTATVLAAIGIWIACAWTPGVPKRNTGIGRMVRFGRDITCFNIVTFFTDSFDQILLGKFYGPGVVGIYRQAYQLVMVPFAQLSGPVHSVGQSALSLLQDDGIKFRQYFGKILTLLSFVTMPLAIFLFIHSKEVVLLVLGERWIDAVVIFRIFAAATFIRPVVSTVGLVMISCGKSKRYFWLGFANSILIITSMIIGLQWGGVGVAAGHVVVNYIAILPSVFVALKSTPIRVELFFQSILPSAVSSLVMGGVLFLFCSGVQIVDSFHAIIASLPVGIGAYLLVWLVIPGGALRLRGLLADFNLLFRKTEGMEVVKVPQ